MSLVLVMVGAAVGAPLRHLTDRAVQGRHGTVLPWGTFTVNVMGSSGARAPHRRGHHGRRVTPDTTGRRHRVLRRAHDLLDVLLGDAPAVRGRRPLLAGVNVVGSILAGLAAAATGFAVGHALFS